MISVLFLIPTLDRGGAENVLVNLVNQMNQSVFKITVQTLFDQNSQKDCLREGIEYRSFLFHQFRGNSRIMAWLPAGFLYRLIVQKQYDIVISYLEGPTSHIISGCPFPNSKKIAWFHSALETERGFHAGFKNKITAINAYKRFDKVVFVAESVRSSIEKVVGEPFENGCVAYNTLNIEEIQNNSNKPIKDFQFLQNEFNIISAGKIMPVKGYDILARVQKRLRDSGYPTHVYLLGTGPDKEDIEVFARENGIKDSITFLGFQSNPYNYIANADLFVCSSRREGFSTAVSEALVLGVPVVSTDCSGAKELLGENNEFGIVAEKNEEGLFRAIKRLLDDPALRMHYRHQARIKSKAFNTSQTVEAVEKMLMSFDKGN